MDDLVKVQVIHPTSDPSGPIHKQPRSDFPACTQDFIELSMCTILHDDTVAWGLSANSPVKGNTYPVRIRTATNPRAILRGSSQGAGE